MLTRMGPRLRETVLSTKELGTDGASVGVLSTCTLAFSVS